MKQFILTEEQWQTIRNLFDENNWVESEDYQLPERSVETGFMSFHSEHDTLAFLVPELVAYTIEIVNDTSVKNRYYTVNKATIELIESQVSDYANAYEPPSGMGG